MGANKIEYHYYCLSNSISITNELQPRIHLTLALEASSIMNIFPKSLRVQVPQKSVLQVSQTKKTGFLHCIFHEAVEIRRHFI